MPAGCSHHKAEATKVGKKDGSSLAAGRFFRTEFSFPQGLAVVVTEITTVTSSREFLFLLRSSFDLHRQWRDGP